MNSSGGTPADRPEDDLSHFIEIAEINHDLHGRALSLYLLDPATIDELKQIFLDAAGRITNLVAGSDNFGCPAGTVRCTRGCCVPTGHLK